MDATNYFWHSISCIWSLKDRFTNKIISEIHDEELKNIIITHKELFMDFITLRNTLCFNINHFWYSERKWNNLSHTYEHHRKIPFFWIRFSSSQFQKKECQNLYSPLNVGTYGYKNIADILNKMEIRIEEFKNTNPFIIHQQSINMFTDYKGLIFHVPLKKTI